MRQRPSESEDRAVDRFESARDRRAMERDDHEDHMVREYRRRFCDHFIPVDGDPWAGTYCKLLKGHSGAHSAHYPAEPEPEAGADYSPHPNVGRLS